MGLVVGRCDRPNPCAARGSGGLVLGPGGGAPAPAWRLPGRPGGRVGRRGPASTRARRRRHPTRTARTPASSDLLGPDLSAADHSGPSAADLAPAQLTATCTRAASPRWRSLATPPSSLAWRRRSQRPPAGPALRRLRRADRRPHPADRVRGPAHDRPLRVRRRAALRGAGPRRPAGRPGRGRAPDRAGHRSPSRRRGRTGSRARPPRCRCPATCSGPSRRSAQPAAGARPAAPGRDRRRRHPVLAARAVPRRAPGRRAAAGLAQGRADRDDLRLHLAGPGRRAGRAAAGQLAGE